MRMMLLLHPRSLKDNQQPLLNQRVCWFYFIYWSTYQSLSLAKSHKAPPKLAPPKPLKEATGLALNTKYLCILLTYLLSIDLPKRQHQRKIEKNLRRRNLRRIRKRNLPRPSMYLLYSNINFTYSSLRKTTADKKTHKTPYVFYLIL